LYLPLRKVRYNFVMEESQLIDPEYSDMYGRIMGNRHTSDYELESSITKEIAKLDLGDAEKFVTEIARWLKKEGWI